MKRPRRATKTAQDDGQQQECLRALRRDGFTCQLCGTHRNLELHHLRRRSRGGDDSAANLLTVCHDCHARIRAGSVQLSVQAAAAH